MGRTNGERLEGTTMRKIDWFLRYNIFIIAILGSVTLYIVLLRIITGDSEPDIALLIAAADITFYLFIMFLIPAAIVRVVQFVFFK